MSSSKSSLDSINGPVRQILKDLIKSAKQRKSKSTSSLCDAYESLKACPIKFTSIEQLLPLAGFGEALLDQIEMQLCEWCDSHSKMYPQARSIASTSKIVPTTMSSGDETDSDLDERSPPKKAKAKAKGQISTSSNSKTITSTAESVDRESKAKKKAAAKEPKAYIPQQRTGTHGILVALYTLTASQPAIESADEAEAGAQYYTKSTIIHFAQPYSDSKYIPKQSSAPSSGFGTNFHSAWGGMKTLINRGYVYRRGNPARFGLSHEGWMIAETCAGRETDLVAGSNMSKLGSVPSTSKSSEKAKTREKKTKKAKNTASDDDDNAMQNDSTELAPSARPYRQEVGPFFYTFLTDSDPPVQTNQRIDAAIRLDDKDYRMNYRIAFPISSFNHPFVKKCVGDISEKGMLMSGWVKEAVCNERAPGLPLQEQAETNKPATDNIQEKVKKRPLQPISNTSRMPASSQEKALSQLTCSQKEIIELLTSSDVEIDGGLSLKLAVRSQAPLKEQRKQDGGNESDSSALSDLAPIKKAPRKRKATKAI